MAPERVFHHRAIAALAEAGPPGRVQHVHSLGPARVALPPLPTGGHVFPLWPVREWPQQGFWAATHYDSFAPPVFVLHDVLLHSSAGILSVGDAVVSETLAHTTPHGQGYRALAKAIALRPGPIRALPGAHVSVLAGGEQDDRHALLDGLARLSCVPQNYLAAVTSLLVPAGSLVQAEALRLLDLLPSLQVRQVGRAETWQVETLVLPLSIHGESIFHPCTGDFFARLSAAVPPAPGRLPRRLYIDRRGSAISPLANENALIDALARLGFVAVRLEALSLAERIRLVRQAEAIVAPYGASLTDLAFARPGCLVVELLMDAFVDWSFRHLAGLLDIRYDCVIGRARHPWPDLASGVRQTAWQVSVNHVVAAVTHSLPQLSVQAA